MEYGLIGEHLGHSYSKEIHEYLADYEYELKEIAPDDLDAFMKAKDFKAINVTIPYKQAVIPYLDEISDIAAEIGAVNTIVNKDGKLWGTNTDYDGLLALARRTYRKYKGKKFLILGTGGTSKTAVFVAKTLEAGSIYRVSRNPETVEDDLLETVEEGQEEPVYKGVISYEQAISEHSDAKIIINTTPVGMYPDIDKMPVDPKNFDKPECVLDVVYNPLRTSFVIAAKGILNVKAAGGLYMLAAQAVRAIECFLDKELPPTDVDKVYTNIKAARRNIVLTGMPSSGKTTIGGLVSEELGKPFVDTDDIIKERIGMEISTFFELEGEEAFRDIESEVIKELRNESGLIIATGGGAILRDVNVYNLKHNGFIFFLERPLELLFPSDDRPLSSTPEDLKKRYRERLTKYHLTCDMTVENRYPLPKVVESVTYFSRIED